MVWVLTVIGIAGVVLNIYKNRWGFFLWMISNAFWTILDFKKGMPEQWIISYNYNNLNLKFRLGFTSFGHIGVFPEQADNWNYIYDTITKQRTTNNEQLRLLVT